MTGGDAGAMRARGGSCGHEHATKAPKTLATPNLSGGRRDGLGGGGAHFRSENG